MDISIIRRVSGSLTSSVREMGHHIIFVGRDTKKLNVIKPGKSPIFEPGLDQLLLKNSEKIETTTDIEEAVKKTELIFICVGTPTRDDGSSDLSQIETVAHSIGKALRFETKYHIIITKSTVLPGKIESLIIPILEKDPEREHLLILALHQIRNFLKREQQSKIFLKQIVLSSGYRNKKQGNYWKNCTHHSTSRSLLQHSKRLR